MNALENFARLASPEAEMSVLGGLLINPEAADRIGALRPEHFWSEAHRTIMSVMLAMIGAGKPIDVVTVAEEIDVRGLSEQTGGLAYLGELAINTPSAANIGSYAKVVVGKALERQLLVAADRIKEAVASTGETRDKLMAAQAAVMEIAEAMAPKAPRIIRDVLIDTVDILAARHDGKVIGLPTGFADLDKQMSGGMRPGNLIFIAGRPSMGKTSLAVQIGLNVAQDEHPVLVLSMEMADQELTDRLISNVGNVSLDAVLQGRIVGEDGDRIMAAVERLHALPLVIDDQGGLTLYEVASKARSVKRKYGLSLLVIDYIQLMTGDGDSRNSQLEQISRGLKSLAKELQIPIIVLSQLSRKCEERNNKRPMLSDLRESGALEQDADVVLFVYRDEFYHQDSPDKGTAEIIAGKNRQGKTGTVRLAYIGDRTRFADLAPGWVPEQREQPMRRRRGGFDG